MLTNVANVELGKMKWIIQKYTLNDELTR